MEHDRTKSAAVDEAFRREEWAAAYQNTEEFPDGFWLQAAAGLIPQNLEGTYFRNGPGLFAHGPDKVAHPFDGHGLMVSISFCQGRAFFRSRYVQTKEYQDEIAAGRILYKGTFGTLVPGGLRRNLLQIAPRNVSNTGVLSTSNRCLAMFEAGQPHRLDPSTLETKGVDLLGGTIEPGAPFSSGWRILDLFIGYLMTMLSIGNNLNGYKRIGGDAVCAHPVQDPDSGFELLFSIRLQIGLVACSFLIFGYAITFWLPGLVTKLSIREFNQDFELVSVVHRTLPGYSFLHDMSITPTKYVIFQNPVRLRMLPLLLGTLCPAQCICWTGNPPLIHLIKRPNYDRGEGARCKVPQPQAIQLDAFCLTSTGTASLPPRRVALSDTGSLDRSRSDQTKNACQQGSGGADLSAVAPQSADANAQPSGTSDEQSCTVGTTCSGTPEAAFVFHQANAFESEDGQTVTVDCIRYPFMPDFQQASSGSSFIDTVDPELQPISQLWRYDVDVCTGKVSGHMLSARAMEFPAVNPNFTGRPHRFIYASAARHPTRNLPQQALVKIDIKSMAIKMWSQDPHYYVGEPVFVPFPVSGWSLQTFGPSCNAGSKSATGAAEDEGWILSVCYNASLHASECVILSATDMKLLARLPLCHVLPHGLHGVWDSTCRL